MSWADVGRQACSPDDIADRVRRAERRRGVAVQACVLAGAGLFLAGLLFYAASAPARGRASVGALAVLALGLMAAGVVVAFPLAALVALALGPTWEQRQQHWRLMRWERERETEDAHAGDAAGQPGAAPGAPGRDL